MKFKVALSEVITFLRLKMETREGIVESKSIVNFRLTKTTVNFRSKDFCLVQCK